MSLYKPAHGLPRFMADCGFWRHPAWVGAGLAAVGLQTCGLSYCYEHETDGWLPGPTHIELAVALGLAAKDVKLPLAVLLKRSRWSALDSRFYVVGYEESNPVKADIRAQREQRSQAGRKGAATRWKHNESDSEPHANGMAGRNGINSNRIGSNYKHESDFNLAWVDYPRKEARVPALKAYEARRREGVTSEELALAVRHFADAMRSRQREHILQGSTFFGPNERWKDFLEPVSNNGQVDPSELGW